MFLQILIEKYSTFNGRVAIDLRLNFDVLPGQKMVFRTPENTLHACYYPINFKK